MADIARLSIVVDSSQLQTLERRLDTLERQGARTEAQAVRTSRALGGLTGAVVALGAALAVRQIIQYADAWAQMQGRLSLVTSTHAEMIQVQERLYQVAQRSRSGIEATSQLYVRLAQNTKELSLTQDQMVRITETVNKALIIGGAAASEVRGGVLQLSQALASGQLRGDEFRSVLENMPRIAIALSDKLKITRAELYELAAQGKITSRTLAETLLQVSAEIDAEFGKLPLTVDGAMVVANNALLRFVGRVNQSAGATMTLANAVNDLALSFDSPEAVEAGVKFAENLAVGIRIAADATLWLGRNLDIIIGILKVLLAMRIVAFIRDVTLAIRLMTAAMSANPFFAFLQALAAVTTALYELSDGFEHWENVIPRVQKGMRSMLDEVEAQLVRIEVQSDKNKTSLGDMLNVIFSPRRAPGDPSFMGMLMGEEPKYPGVGANAARQRQQALNSIITGGGLPKGFENTLTDEQRASVKQTQEVIDYIVNAWAEGGRKIAAGWSALGDGLVTITKAIVNPIVGIFMAGFDLISGGLTALATLAAGIFNQIIMSLRSISNALAAVGNFNLMDTSTWATAAQSIGTAIQNIVAPDFSKPFDEALAVIDKAWRDAGEDLRRDYVAEFDVMLREAAEAVAKAAKGIIHDPFLKWIDSLGDYFARSWAGFMQAAELETRRRLNPPRTQAPDNVGTAQFVDGSMVPVPGVRPNYVPPIDTNVRGEGYQPDDKGKRDPYAEAKRKIEDLLQAQQRLATAYMGGTGAVAAAERATERYNAISDLQSKKITPAQRAELTALINTTYDLKDANVAAAQAMQIREGLQRDTERAQLEISLLGSPQEKINTEIRLLEIRNQLIDQGIPNAAAIAETFRAQVEGAERVNAVLERQKAAASAISDIFTQAFDRVGSAITEAFTKGEAAAINFQSITEGVLSEILQAIVKFTILNPLKNAVFGGNDPTVGDIGGILGDILGNKPKTDETKPANDNTKTELDKLLAGGLNATVGSATLSIGSATVTMGTAPGSLIPDRPDVTISGTGGVNTLAGGAGDDTLEAAGTKIAANANTFGDTFGGVLGRLANSMAGSSNIFVQGFGSILSALLQGIQGVSNAMGGSGGGGGFFSAIGQFFGSLFGGGATSSSAPYVGSADAAFYHSGGIVGTSTRVRRLSFADLPHFHSGGIANDEMLGVLKRGEEVLTRRDPRHRDNLAGGEAVGYGAPQVVVNSIVENHTGAQVQQREQRNSSGGVDLVTVIGNAAASEMGRHGSPMSKQLQQNYGAQPVLRGR